MTSTVPRISTFIGGAQSDERIRNIYVHAPFCAQLCRYCDYAVSVDRAPQIGPWLTALSRELAAIDREQTFIVADELSTVYVGGGTPSLLGADAMQGVADVLGPTRMDGPDLEWTAEANPESFTSDVARSWARDGVNRISLGIQSFHGPALAWMGRLHGPEEALRATRLAHEAGFDNLSIDLILGLPSHLGRDWSQDLRTVLRLRPAHLSLYGLTVEPGTAFARAVADGRETKVDEVQYREEYLFAAQTLTDEGYDHYEVSSFALAGRRSRHSSAYWSGVAYLGLGNGAHSYQHPTRRWNLRSWTDYQKKTAAHQLPLAGTEQLSIPSHRLEWVWLNLRARSGVNPAALPVAAAGLLQRWMSAGLAIEESGRCRLTPEGWLVLDRLTVELDQALGTTWGTDGAERTELRHPRAPSGRPGIDV